MKPIDKMREIAIKMMQTKNMRFYIQDLGESIHFEPDTRDAVKKGHFDGKQIHYFKDINVFELSEYMAGAKQDQLHILGNFKTFKSALTALLSGRKIKPIQIY